MSHNYKTSAYLGLRAVAIAMVTVITASDTARAGWLTIGNPPPSNVISLTSGSHPLSLPGWGGTASVSVLNAWGSGSLELRSYAYNPAQFIDYPTVGLNPQYTDQFAVQGRGETSPATSSGVSVQFNFTGLTSGTLPAGSVFTISDLDVHESLKNLAAFDSSGNLIVSPWLNLKASFDANGSFDFANPTGPSDYPTIIGTYNLTSPNTNTDIPTLYFETTQAVTSLQFDGEANLGPRGYGVAFGVAVPEPNCLASTATLGLVTIAGWVRRRRIVR